MTIVAIYAAVFALAFVLLRWEHRESIGRMPVGPHLEARSDMTLRLYRKCVQRRSWAEVRSEIRKSARSRR